MTPDNEACAFCDGCSRCMGEGPACSNCHGQGCGLCIDLVAQERDDEIGAFGDARRCPIHPGVKTSSDDGMFDGPCHLCEGEMDAAACAWDLDPTNPRRPYCNDVPPVLCPIAPYFKTVGCDDALADESEIPF